MTDTTLPTPTGPYMVPFVKLSTMLASSPTQQERAGLTGDPNAVDRCLEKIPYPVVEEETGLRPYFPAIVLTPMPGWRWAEVAQGALKYIRPVQGRIRMIFADATHYPESQRAGLIDFGNWLGGVIGDLRDVNGASDNLVIKSIDEESPPGMCSRIEENNGGLYFLASLIITWGD